MSYNSVAVCFPELEQRKQISYVTLQDFIDILNFEPLVVLARGICNFLVEKNRTKETAQRIEVMQETVDSIYTEKEKQKLEKFEASVIKLEEEYKQKKIKFNSELKIIQIECDKKMFNHSIKFEKYLKQNKNIAEELYVLKEFLYQISDILNSASEFKMVQNSRYYVELSERYRYCSFKYAELSKILVNGGK